MKMIFTKGDTCRLEVDFYHGHGLAELPMCAFRGSRHNRLQRMREGAPISAGWPRPLVKTMGLFIASHSMARSFQYKSKTQGAKFSSKDQKRVAGHSSVLVEYACGKMELF